MSQTSGEREQRDQEGNDEEDDRLVSLLETSHRQITDNQMVVCTKYTIVTMETVPTLIWT